MNKLLLMLALALTTVSCGPRYVDYFPYHDDGTCKPAVALLPVIDKTSCMEPAGRIITQIIRNEAMDLGELYLLSGEELNQGMAKLGKVDFYSSDAAFAESFCEADFAVVLELLDQQFTPFGAPEPTKNCSIISYPCETLLTLKMRVKIIDLRPRCPRVALQEIYTQGYYMPRSGCEDAEMLSRGYRRFALSLHNRLGQIIRSAY